MKTALLALLLLQYTAWHDAFIYVTCLIHMCDAGITPTAYDSFICVTWLIHMRDMTHSYAWHDSFIYVTWLMTTLGVMPAVLLLQYTAIHGDTQLRHGTYIQMSHGTTWHEACPMTHLYICAMTHVYAFAMNHLYIYICAMPHVKLARGMAHI